MCVCVCVCFSAGSRLSQGQEQLRLVFVPLKDKGTLCCWSAGDEQQQTPSDMRADDGGCQLLYKHWWLNTFTLKIQGLIRTAGKTDGRKIATRDKKTSSSFIHPSIWSFVNGWWVKSEEKIYNATAATNYRHTFTCTRPHNWLNLMANFCHIHKVVVAIRLTQECTTNGPLVMKADMAERRLECVLMYFCFLFISPAPFVIRVSHGGHFLLTSHSGLGGSNAIQV